ncbi:UbiA family prenyltransferase [Streptomyces sp. NPDC095613]|uniref:UbiA family prenyltransferase n=1 Tax=Streptomyces sp. NPDC095613 TaxID=3155540 RepID=UPI0033165300
MSPRGRGRLRAWAELLRVSALFTVPGDALAGASALGVRPHRGTALAVGASLCLYEAGMALNDWADRDEDAVDRPHRPIPSGRVSAPAALAAAGALTAGGLALAARAGRAPLAVGTALAATVWAYDLKLKHTAAGPAAMGAARALDLLLGATATAAPAGGHTAPPGAGRTAPRPGGAATERGTGPSGSRPRPGPTGAAGTGRGPRGAGSAVPAPPGPRGRGARLSPDVRSPGAWAAARAALPSAALLGAHTVAVTTVSRHETQGGSTKAPLAALAATAALALFTARPGTPPAPRTTGPSPDRTPAPSPYGPPASRSPAPAGPGTAGSGGSGSGGRVGPGRFAAGRTASHRALTAGLAASYLATAAPPLLHAVLNPSPPLTQRAVGRGIRAMIPFQAALAARGGVAGAAVGVMGLVPLARTVARKVSPT